MKLEPHGVGHERLARQPRPFDRALAFLDPLLAGAALVVECDHALGRAAHVRHDEADARIQFLRELGYIEGQNLIVEYRFAEGREERYSDFATELVALPVDLIVTWGPPAAFARSEERRVGKVGRDEDVRAHGQ